LGWRGDAQREGDAGHHYQADRPVALLLVGQHILKHDRRPNSGGATWVINRTNIPIIPKRHERRRPRCSRGHLNFDSFSSILRNLYSAFLHTPAGVPRTAILSCFCPINEPFIESRLSRVCKMGGLRGKPYNRKAVFPVDKLSSTEPDVLERPASSVADQTPWERDRLAVVTRALAEGGTRFFPCKHSHNFMLDVRISSIYWVDTR
jgi:hypothetical protein